MRRRKTSQYELTGPCVGKVLSLLFMTTVFTLSLLTATGHCSEEEAAIEISADSLQYFSRIKKYEAKGSVTITKGDQVMEADTVTYYEDSGEVTAEGNVRYRDSGVAVTASRAELNLKLKTGRLYDANLLYKQDNYHLAGAIIEKRGENYYFAEDGTFTTCDAPIPAWCFTGRKIDAVIGEGVTARDVSFRLKNVPVLYAPYLWVPLLAERQTGFLLPSVGYSKTRGLSINVPFYWAIAEDRDATLSIDSYSKRGIGTGLEYRFIKEGGVESSWWAYHLRDRQLGRDFWEVDVLYENRAAMGFDAYLDVNYVNEKDFYREFSAHRDIRVQRFLESTGEIYRETDKSRLYLLSSYWVDLQDDTDDIPQKLPEAGYILHYRRMGTLLSSTSVTASNFWREDGLSARRLDVYPVMMHSVGDDYTLSQKVALRGTLYDYYKDYSDNGSSEERLAFEYMIGGHTRLHRNYSSFKHVIEPSLTYHFISSSDNNLPIFDATEVYRKTSRFELSLLNRVIVGEREIMAMRATQPFEAYNGDRPFLPLRLEVGIKEPIPLIVSADYNVNSGGFETVSSDLTFPFYQALVSVGQRYNRKEDILFYRTRIEYSPARDLHMTGSLWYDAKGGGVRDVTLTLTYFRQCWGIQFEFVKKPEDYSFAARVELRGLISTISRR